MIKRVLLGVSLPYHQKHGDGASWPQAGPTGLPPRAGVAQVQTLKSKPAIHRKDQEIKAPLFFIPLVQ